MDDSMMKFGVTSQSHFIYIHPSSKRHSPLFEFKHVLSSQRFWSMMFCILDTFDLLLNRKFHTCPPKNTTCHTLSQTLTYTYDMTPTIAMSERKNTFYKRACSGSMYDAWRIFVTVGSAVLATSVAAFLASSSPRRGTGGVGFHGNFGKRR